jgi:D-threo-aldose 1-dehydrogenase
VHDPDEYLAVARADAAERQRRMAHLVEAYGALAELRARGAVLAVGLGAKDWRVARELSGRVRLDWVMIACSLTVRTHPAELRAWVAAMAAQGVRVINSAIFHGGFLTGGDFYDYRRVDARTQDGRSLLAWRDAFTAACRRHGVAPAHAAVRFANGMPGVASLALGTSDPARVEGLVRMALTPVPAQLWSDLAEAGLIERGLALAP